MKTKRRHELQENMLLSELRKAWEFLKKHGNRLATAALIIAVLIFAYVFWSRTSESKLLTVQSQWDQAVSAAAAGKLDDQAKLLEELTAQTGDRRIAALACAEFGYNYATKAMLAKTPSERTALEESAAKWYLKTVAEFPTQSLAVAKAQFGLGKLYESQRKFNEAAEQYRLARSLPDMVGQPVTILAEGSLKRLKMLEPPVLMASTMPASAPAASAPAPAASAPAPAASAPAPAASAPAPAASAPAPAATAPATQP